LKVTFLGTGTSTGIPVITCHCRVCTSDDPRDNRTRPSILLEWNDHVVLVDTSSDFRQQALRHDMHRLDAVLYTHHHADHIMGLDELRLFNWRQRMVMPAYGSKETLDAVGRTFWYVFEDSQKGGGKPAMEMNPVTGPFDLLGRQIVPIPVFHGEMEIYGYRIGNFAYLTDVSRVPDESIHLLQGVEVAVVSALRATPHSTHQNVEQAIALSGKIGADRTFFTHMCHDLLHAETDAELPEGIRLAYDGLVLDNLA
jgi:phosphoribosyl 1,2-cyclic phosphate phosphodiesterase